MDLSNQVLFDELTKAVNEGILNGFSDRGCIIHLEKFVENTKLNFQTNPKTSVQIFVRNLRLKWKTAGRQRARFLNSYNEWLSKSAIAVASNFSTAGRPNVSFGDASERTKKRKTSALMCVSPPRLYFATSKVLQRQGHSRQAKAIQNLSITDKKGYSAVKALALIIDNNFSK